MKNSDTKGSIKQIGKNVQEFYNRTPFPDYEVDKFQNKNALLASAYSIVTIYDRSIPSNASIIDVGCGTGQLAAYLSLKRKCVYGIDFSDTSLKKARSLKAKLNLRTLHLKKVDVLNVKQLRDIGMKFDYVLCHGVLHHTYDAYQGFKNILELLKPNGFIAIGLYNKFGRVPLKIRRILVNTLFKNNDKIKKWFISMQIGDTTDKERARGWWNDQYLHPHETTHTVGEVLKWFRKNGIRYYQSLPSLTFFDDSNLEIGGLWNNSRNIYPYLPIRLYKQLTWIWKTHKEGGYWTTFGRRTH